MRGIVVFNVLLLGACLLSSCSFSEKDKLDNITEPEKKTKSSNNKLLDDALPRSKTVISWKNSNSGDLSQFSFKERVLVPESSIVYSAELPLTLPPEVPNTLKVEFEIPFLIEKELLIFSKAYVYLGGNKYELITSSLKLNQYSNKTAASLEVSGLKTVFTDKTEVIGTLKVDIFEEANKKLFTITSTLRTPPSEISIEKTHVNSFNPLHFNLSDGVRLVAASSTTATLLRVIKIKNRSETNIVFEMPTNALGSVSASFYKVSHEDTGCEGKGYKLPERRWTEVYSEKLILVPLFEELIPIVNLTTSNSNTMSAFSVSLAPEEEVLLGVYGEGEKIQALIKDGYKSTKSDLTSFLKKCERVKCLKPKHGKCHYSPKTDVWQCADDSCDEWEISRKTGHWPIGIDSTPVYLDIKAQKKSIFVRFDDLSQEEDPEGRTISLLNDRTILFE